MSNQVSVIIPAYNAEPWIGACLESVLRQTCTELEVLVIDDGSTDGTAGVVESVTDPRVRLERQANEGAAAARNRGLRQAQGDFIQFLDADDLLAPNKIECQLSVLRTRRNKAIASCAWWRFEDDISKAWCTPEPVWAVDDPVDWLVRSLQGGGMMALACWLTPRPLIDAAGPWDESLSLHDDGEFFARVLLRAEELVYVPNTRMFYRTVANSLSRRRNSVAIESAFKVCQSRDRNLLAVQDDHDARRAIATQYAQFAYEFAGQAPDLAAQSIKRLQSLGVRPRNSVGGTVFRSLTRLLGFQRALRLRSLAFKECDCSCK